MNNQTTDIKTEVTDTEIIITIDDRRWRVRGLEKQLSHERLKVNLMVSRKDLTYVNTFDLYLSGLRKSFLKEAAAELYIEESILKQDFGKLLITLETLQAEKIRQTLQRSEPEAPKLTEAEETAALELLKDESLLDRILADYDTCGLVGEETNKLICYLACVSRKLSQPLAVLIQSSSAAGKTTLMDAALAFVPPEEQVKYSAMTGQSLYYMGQTNLKHKILAIAEEEGVTQASYALKLLQSEGKLTIASAEKDGDSGRQQTQEYQVEGPVMMFLTTTAENPDPELANRCVTLRVNERSEQTAAIHQRQRDAYTLDACADCEAIRTLHQNAQRLLEPLPVIIPWADQLTFRSDQTRMRRDNAKYLALIASITLLHQYQRERVTRTSRGESETCVVATIEDIETANRLASEAFGQSLDSIMPQTRQLLVLLDDHIEQLAAKRKIPRSEIRFTQRELRETLGWSDRQLRRHLHRLIELEYVLAFRTGFGNQKSYQLVYQGEGRDGSPFLLGLIDTAKLRKTTQRQATGGQKRRSAPQPAGKRRPSGQRPASTKNGATTKHSKTLRTKRAHSAK